jgi:hypothetical protein
MSINSESTFEEDMKVALITSSFDVINAIGGFVAYFFLTIYLWWLLGLDQTRFRGTQNDFKVSANVEATEVKLDLMRPSNIMNKSMVSELLQNRR